MDVYTAAWGMDEDGECRHGGGDGGDGYVGDRYTCTDGAGDGSEGWELLRLPSRPLQRRCSQDARRMSASSLAGGGRGREGTGQLPLLPLRRPLEPPHTPFCRVGSSNVDTVADSMR